jgi:hypothetical protein
VNTYEDGLSGVSAHVIFCFFYAFKFDASIDLEVWCVGKLREYMGQLYIVEIPQAIR